MEDMSEIIGVFNYVLNFFLYCFCGSAFRNSLYQLLTGCRENLNYVLVRMQTNQDNVDDDVNYAVGIEQIFILKLYIS